MRRPPFWSVAPDAPQSDMALRCGKAGANELRAAQGADFVVSFSRQNKRMPAMDVNIKALTMTGRFSDLPKEDLANMLLAWREMSFRERVVMAPLVAKNERLFARWAGAGVGRFGFVPEKKAARRLERRRVWLGVCVREGMDPFAAGPLLWLLAFFAILNPLARPWVSKSTDSDGEEFFAPLAAFLPGLLAFLVAVAAVAGAIALETGAWPKEIPSAPPLLAAALAFYATRLWLASGPEIFCAVPSWERSDEIRRGFGCAWGRFLGRVAAGTLPGVAARVAVVVESTLLSPGRPRAKAIGESLDRAASGLPPSDSELRAANEMAGLTERIGQSKKMALTLSGAVSSVESSSLDESMQGASLAKERPPCSL